MRKINEIIVHCSASRWGDAAEVRKWHLERGFNDIGYHYVILNGRIKLNEIKPYLCGYVEEGRSLQVAGAHAEGHNAHSIGICLIGKDVFHKAQLDALINLCLKLCHDFDIGIISIRGHCELEGVKKTCPNFPMELLRNTILLCRGYFNM